MYRQLSRIIKEKFAYNFAHELNEFFLNFYEKEKLFYKKSKKLLSIIAMFKKRFGFAIY